MALRGSLADVPLTDILQLVSESRRTGAFVLQSSDHFGAIYLETGSIVHAHLGNHVGEEAIYEIAALPEAEFVFKADLTTTDHTIDKSTPNLLMESARRIDEWQLLNKLFPSMQMIPRLKDQGWTTSVSFAPEEWSVIVALDRRRTIEEVATLLNLPLLEVCKTLYGLVTKGLVQMEETTVS